MEINPLSIFNLLRSTPGNLAYYLILIYSLISLTFSLTNSSRAGRNPNQSRTFVGISVLFFAIILPAVSIPFIVFSGSMPAGLYPILERTSLSLLIIWIAWLWIVPNRSTGLDITALILTFLIPGILIVLVGFFPINGAPFNGSPPDIIWHFVIILITLFFTLVLIRRNISNGAYGVGMMVLMLLGFSLSLIFIDKEGDISGAARLGILCAVPLLQVLALRQESLSPSTQTPSAFETIMTQTVVKPQNDEINIWLDAAGNSDSIRQQGEFARILCQTMDASACIILQPSNRPGIIRLNSGYDISDKSWIDSKELTSDGIPKTVEYMNLGIPSVINKTSESFSETDKFSAWLKLENIVSMAVLPINDSTIQWGAALMFRTSDYPSFQEDNLLPYGRTMTALMNIFKNNEIIKKDKQDINILTTEVNALVDRNHKLQTNLDALRLSAVQVWPEPDLNQVLSLQQASQSEIEKIRNENQLLLQALAEQREDLKPTSGGSHSENIAHELESARNDLSHLQNLLNDSNLHIKEMEKRTTFSVDSIERLREFHTLTTQIRNPVAAITGYVDLLLTDNETQKDNPENQSTLENLKSSLDRLRKIMDNLAEINVLESGVIDMEPESMDLSSAIDQAISHASPSLSEKGISIKLNLPESLPAMQTYHEALQKVIIHLLQNAGKTTPPNGTVEIRMDIHEESSEPYLLLEISDGGGGIAPEYLNKVFLPADQRNGQPIQGLGETGNGLSVSKTLVEAHGGRMWVDSNPGIGTTFSVLLPIKINKPADEQQIP
jgi:signal transduction histidine kinase